MFDALPSGNGRLSGKNYWLPVLRSVRPASRPGRLFVTGPEGGFPGGRSCQALINPGLLSLFSTCTRPSRRAYIAICQVYCYEHGLSSNLRIGIIAWKCHISLHNAIAWQAKGKCPLHILAGTTWLAHHILCQGLPAEITGPAPFIIGI